MNESTLHVVFGSGQIGTRIARILLARGHRVRLVSRTPAPPVGAEATAGDARDLAFAAEAARGAGAASVIYDCTNPLYHHWRRDLLALGAGPLHAATVTGARLVALDCLYMYGAPDGAMTEATPMAATTRKGVLRAELAELRLGAMQRGDARVTIARASDFFGANLPASWWSERFFTRILAGKPAECLGDPDQLHSYTYADDLAVAMVALGDATAATGADSVDGVWHVPTVAAETTRQLATRVGGALGVSVTMATMSPWLLRALGVVAPVMGELREMAYQWQVPFVLDDRKFRARFPEVLPTPVDEQVAAVAAWARSRFTSARARQPASHPTAQT